MVNELGAHTFLLNQIAAQNQMEALGVGPTKEAAEFKQRTGKSLGDVASGKESIGGGDSMFKSFKSKMGETANYVSKKFKGMTSSVSKTFSSITGKFSTIFSK